MHNKPLICGKRVFLQLRNTPQRGNEPSAQGNVLGYYRRKQTTPRRGKSIIQQNTQFMSQSLCKIYLHIVFHIKTTSPSIKEEHLERLHSYMGQLVNTTSCQTIQVGGVSDHVHLLCQLSKNETVAHLVEEVKRNSSRWIKTIDEDYQSIIIVPVYPERCPGLFAFGLTGRHLFALTARTACPLLRS